MTQFAFDDEKVGYRRDCGARLSTFTAHVDRAMSVSTQYDANSIEYSDVACHATHTLLMCTRARHIS